MSKQVCEEHGDLTAALARIEAHTETLVEGQKATFAKLDSQNGRARALEVGFAKIIGTTMTLATVIPIAIAVIGMILHYFAK